MRVGNYTILELWNGEWWRWVMKDGKPVAFIKEDAIRMNEFVESYGCHWAAVFKERARPKSWRSLFEECRRCLGHKTEVEAAGIKFWLCVPCAQNTERIFGDYH